MNAFQCNHPGCVETNPHGHTVLGGEHFTTVGDTEVGPPTPDVSRETGEYVPASLPIWVHLRTQAGGPGEGHILRLRDDSRSYDPIVSGKNDQLAEMLDYLEAGERYLHGPRT